MDYAQQQRNPAKHLIGFLLVSALHVVVIYALVNGLARKVVEVIKGPAETKIIEEHKPPPPPEAPPPPPPKLTIPPPPFIPPPEIDIAIAAPIQNTISQVSTKPPPAPVTIKPVPRQAVSASLDRGSCSAGPEPQYPMASRRNQEVGSLTLRIQVDPNGLPGKVEIARSSGHARLDEAAKTWVATCKFKAAKSDDGKTIASWATQPYTFTLRD